MLRIEIAICKDFKFSNKWTEKETDYSPPTRPGSKEQKGDITDAVRPTI